MRKVDHDEYLWRALSPKWAHDPLSGDGAKKNGGRFNPLGTPALYMSFTPDVAFAEYNQELGYRPATLCAYKVMGAKIVDLTDFDTRRSLSVDVDTLKCAWKEMHLIQHKEPPTWALARYLIEQGVDGIIVPSTVILGRNMVLWRWEGIVEVIDPLGELPRGVPH